MSAGERGSATGGSGIAGSRIAELALVGMAAIWGATFVMVQDAVTVFPVFTFLAYRFGPAALLVALIFPRPLAKLGRAGWRAGASMGVFLTSGYVFQTFSLQRTTASNAGFITGLFVVLTPVLVALFFGRPASRLTWIAAAVSAAGLFLLSGAGASLHLAGDVLAFAGAGAFALQILATGDAVERHHAGALLAVQLGVCGAVTLVAASLLGQLDVPPSRQVWVALAVTSVVASALGFLIQTYAQSRTSPARTALILASEAAFAGLFAYLLNDERLAPLRWAGAGLILGSIVLLELAPRWRMSARNQPGA